MYIYKESEEMYRAMRIHHKSKSFIEVKETSALENHKAYKTSFPHLLPIDGLIGRSLT